MLKKILIKNFNSIKDSKEIVFNEDLTVLVGQNESGKSSILDAIDAYENYSNIDTLNFNEKKNGNNTQKISCTYGADVNFANKLINVLRDKFSLNETNSFFNVKKLKTIKEYTITKTIDFSGIDTKEWFTIDNNAFSILKASINKTKKNEKELIEKIFPDWNNTEIQRKISNCFWSISPKIVLFNDFQNLLPDEFLIQDLITENKESKGYEAVKNFEKINNFSFIKINEKKWGYKRSRIEEIEKEITIKFQEDWKQRINKESEVKIKFSLESNKICFYVTTKELEYLPPRKRSKGMIWFLSLWLKLKANEKDEQLILLFDEPGSYLHNKACLDLLKLFDKLNLNGHQIVYTTHQAPLIDENKLNKIGLVINDKDNGTKVEKLTSATIDTENKMDALQPISMVMGLTPWKGVGCLNHKNVIVEGITDFYYFESMSKLLNIKKEYRFVPGIGVKGGKINVLISFCIGYGLNYVVVLDKGYYSNNLEIIKSNKKIILKKKNIEDNLAIDDLKLVDPSIQIQNQMKIPLEVIGKKRKMMFAKIFFDKVNKKKINKENLQKSTLLNFKKIFEEIEKKLK